MMAMQPSGLWVPSGELATWLIGCWAMNDGPGSGVVNDLSGRNNHGTLTDMAPATAWVSGERWWALDFDGSADRVELGTAIVTQLTGAAGCTFAAMVMREADFSSPQRIIVDQDTALGSAKFSVDCLSTTYQVRCGGRSRSSDSYQSLTYSAPLQLNTWHSVVCQMDLPNDLIRIWVDGVLEQGSVSFGGNVFDSTAYGGCAIGGYPANAYSRTFDGRIASCYMWGRALDAGSVAKVVGSHYSMASVRSRQWLYTVGGATEWQLSGVSAGTSYDSAAMTAALAAAGISAGTSADTATLCIIQLLQGASAGNAADAAVLSSLLALSGVSPGSAVDAAALNALMRFVGTSIGSSLDLGTLTQGATATPIVEAAPWSIGVTNALTVRHISGEQFESSGRRAQAYLPSDGTRSQDYNKSSGRRAQNYLPTRGGRG